MKWYRPILAAGCGLAVGLSMAFPAMSRPIPEAPGAESARVACIDSPEWFAPIHRAYNCDAKITPSFDFASLYAGPKS
jgi:hypothetical protein